MATAPPLELRPNVTLEWPKDFKLSYTDIAVYDLLLRNGKREPLAMVNEALSMGGFLLRPSCFIVPGNSQMVLTLAFQPAIQFETLAGAPWEKTQHIIFSTVHLTSNAPINLDDLFSDQIKISTTPLKARLNFTIIKLTEDEKTASIKDGYHFPGVNGLNVPRLLFRSTSPGYLTAYVFIYCSLSPTATETTAWRLSAKYPFWFSVENHPDPEKGIDLSEADGAGFDIFIDRGYKLTYIDFKGDARYWLPDCSFTLQTFTLHPDKNGHVSGEKIHMMVDSFRKGFNRKTDMLLSFQLLKDELPEKLTPEVLPKETPTLTFSGPYNRAQSASITISNESKTHKLVYQVRAQEPSLYRMVGTAEGGCTLGPKDGTESSSRSANYTVELINLREHFKSQPSGGKVNRKQFFRLDTFLLHDLIQENGKINYREMRMNSFDARQVETTFIAVIFKDEEELEAAEKGQMAETMTAGNKEKSPTNQAVDAAHQQDTQPPLASTAKQPPPSAEDKQALFGVPNDRPSTESPANQQFTGSPNKFPSPPGTASKVSPGLVDKQSPTPSRTPKNESALATVTNRRPQTPKVATVGQLKRRMQKATSRQKKVSPTRGFSVGRSRPPAVASRRFRMSPKRRSPFRGLSPVGEPTTQDIAVIFTFLLFMALLLLVINAAITNLA